MTLNELRSPEVKNFSDIKPEKMTNGSDIYQYSIVSSTQDTLKSIAKGDEIEIGTTVLASVQTNGIGTRGRSWYSQEGNLHASVWGDFLKDAKSDTIRNNVWRMAAAITTKLLADSIVELSERDLFQECLSIRPFNDIVLDFKGKLAGVMIQGEVIGIGVNFQSVDSSLIETDGITQKAASFADIEGVDITPFDLIENFAIRLKSFLDNFRDAKSKTLNDNGNQAQMLQAEFSGYKEYCKGLIGKRVQVYGQDHKSLIIEGALDDIIRTPANGMMQIQVVVTKDSGETLRCEPGGIKVIDNKLTNHIFS